jgi:hypothetical protein
MVVVVIFEEKASRELVVVVIFEEKASRELLVVEYLGYLGVADKYLKITI